jgi:hypothetical protein
MDSSLIKIKESTTKHASENLLVLAVFNYSKMAGGSFLSIKYPNSSA